MEHIPNIVKNITFEFCVLNAHPANVSTIWCGLDLSMFCSLKEQLHVHTRCPCTYVALWHPCEWYFRLHLFHTTWSNTHSTHAICSQTLLSSTYPTYKFASISKIKWMMYCSICCDRLSSVLQTIVTTWSKAHGTMWTGNMSLSIHCLSNLKKTGHSIFARVVCDCENSWS